MCTALIHNNLFGRTLDLERSYGEQVVVVPRRFPLAFRMQNVLSEHHAIIGMAHISLGQPLFYDGVNEHGLAMAALNFPHSAVYQPHRGGMVNLAAFELMSWVLARCSTVAQAQQLLEQVNVIGVDFSTDLPSTPLHWLIADRTQSIVAEPLADGLHLYENPTGVLTNEPPFPVQLAHLNNYLHLSTYPPQNHFAPTLPLRAYSRGMGTLGLPGDWSSQSRFVRAAFAAHNSTAPADVTRFFRLMACVEVPGGCVRLEDGTEVLSIYTSCCDLNRGLYHYVTCTNRQISAIDLHRQDLNSNTLSHYPLITEPQIRLQS